MGELILENRSDRGLVVNIASEVHVDFVSVGVGVLGRVGASEVLILDDEKTVCRGHKRESERALKVLTGRGVVEVYGVGLEHVVAVGCRVVDILVDFAGIERRVMEVADDEGDSVRSRLI